VSVIVPFGNRTRTRHTGLSRWRRRSCRDILAGTSLLECVRGGAARKEHQPAINQLRTTHVASQEQQWPSPLLYLAGEL
jgi:hypothetical protein